MRVCSRHKVFVVGGEGEHDLKWQWECGNCFWSNGQPIPNQEVPVCMWWLLSLSWSPRLLGEKSLLAMQVILIISRMDHVHVENIGDTSWRKIWQACEIFFSTTGFHIPWIIGELLSRFFTLVPISSSSPNHNI